MHRRLLVIGGARCVWEDIAAARRVGKYHAVAAVNDVGTEYPDDIAFWVTQHDEKLRGWQQRRARNGFNTDYIAVFSGPSRMPGEYPDGAPRIDRIVDYRFPGMRSSGSSGLYAVKIGLEDGYSRIVLAGVPMQSSQCHYFDETPWAKQDMFVNSWYIALPFIRDTVRSVSGWTRELLGAPTPEWLGVSAEVASPQTGDTSAPVSTND